MKRREPPPEVVDIDEAKELIWTMSLAMRRRPIVMAGTDEAAIARDAAKNLCDLAEAEVPDLDAARAQYNRLPWRTQL